VVFVLDLIDTARRTAD